MLMTTHYHKIIFHLQNTLLTVGSTPGGFTHVYSTLRVCTRGFFDVLRVYKCITNCSACGGCTVVKNIATVCRIVASHYYCYINSRSFQYGANDLL